MTGGGHTDYHGNEVYLFPLEQRRWLRLTQPYPSNGLSKGQAGRAPAARLSELAAYWPEFDTAYGDYDGSIPEQAHTYDFVDVLPSASGGGTQGGLIRLIGPGSGKGSFNFRGTHVCDLATGHWSRYALAPASGYAGGSAYDPERRQYYMLCSASSAWTSRLHVLQTASRRWSTRTTRNEVPVEVESAACVFPPADLLLYVRGMRAAAPELWALPLDVERAAWTRLRTEGSGPTRENGSSRGFGLAFCPMNRALYCVPGGRNTGLWRLTAPATRHLEAAWTWEAEPLQGAIAAAHRGPVYDRLRWAPAVKSFVWVDGVSGPVQLIRPAMS
jgi:hypothetical protein